ncbi:MAG TPA: DUF86 domain-containing protein [Methanocorpusculum sp.]|nr:DUF86 domain-containing protein [Methanocorpusculum sp.]
MVNHEEVISRLDDIIEQCTNITDCTDTMSYEEFLKNTIYNAAVIRFFEIIGEASRNIALHDEAADFPQIPWKKLIGLRNILIHEYPGVDLEMLWYFSKKQIPQLKQDAKRMKDVLSQREN